MFYESATAGRAASYKSRSAANLAIIPLFLVPVSRSLLILLLLLVSLVPPPSGTCVDEWFYAKGQAMRAPLHGRYDAHFWSPRCDWSVLDFHRTRSYSLYPAEYPQYPRRHRGVNFFLRSPARKFSPRHALSTEQAAMYLTSWAWLSHYLLLVLLSFKAAACLSRPGTHHTRTPPFHCVDIGPH